MRSGTSHIANSFQRSLPATLEEEGQLLGVGPMPHQSQYLHSDRSEQLHVPHHHDPSTHARHWLMQVTRFDLYRAALQFNHGIVRVASVDYHARL